MIRASLFVLACGVFVLACGHQRPPRIEGPPPEYEMPEDYDAGADAEATDSQ